MLDIEQVDVILDELVRMGLIEEIWVEGEDIPRYRAKVTDRKKALDIIQSFDDIIKGGISFK